MTRETTVVLDTNVVLDWLVFGNPSVRPLVQAIETRRLRWITSKAMRDELAHVLGRNRGLGARQPDDRQLWATWDRLAVTHQTLAPITGEGLRLRCTDPDDQKFVDLALSASRWLISRDRAVLKLARRAAALGVQVLTPEQWSAAHGH